MTDLYNERLMEMDEMHYAQELAIENLAFEIWRNDECTYQQAWDEAKKRMAEEYEAQRINVKR